MNALETAHSILPSLLNLGSGKDFRDDAFNIDIDDSWAPDAILDLSCIDLGEGEIIVPTKRFGDVRLRKGCFDRIIANDVLEHVPDLMKLMTTCLQLLKTGGKFEISVPYDMSFGAWQDPTHVRAFNERSWLYYTDWFWYMGWDTARFSLDNLQFVCSPIGHNLQQKGMDDSVILGTPRAIDSMSASLRKIDLTEADKATWLHWRERRKAAQDRFVAKPVVTAAQPTKTAFAGSWESQAHRYCIYQVTPSGYAHHHAFDDVAVALGEAFSDNGGSAPIVRRPDQWGNRIPIVLGAHLLTGETGRDLPPEAIIYNFEQVDRASPWMTGSYMDLLRGHPVLDYSKRNTDALRAQGITHAQCLSLGYAQALTRIQPASDQDIDVCFYGCINERRAAVLDRLRQQGVAVTNLFGVYGAERDAIIARSKIVLNMHFYDASIFESARVSYLLANSAFVISEGVSGDPDLTTYQECIAVCSYDQLVATCVEALSDESLRRDIAGHGFKIFSRYKQSDLLRSLFPS